MKRIFGIVSAVAALSLVTACQDDGSTKAPASSPPASATLAPPASIQPPATQQSPTTTRPAGDTAPATAGNGKCVDPKSPVVTAALAKLGPGVGGENYTPESATDAPVGSCPSLLWVLAATPHGTASSPWHVLLFNHAGFLGTATKKATSYTQVTGSTDRTVQIQYRWLAGSDPSCCPSGGPVTITLTLGADGHTVTPDRDFPKEVTDPSK